MMREQHSAGETSSKTSPGQHMIAMKQRVAAVSR